MKELDALLSRHLQRMVDADAAAGEWADFEALLEREDDQLWDWLSGRFRPADPAIDELVQRIRSPA